jgi:transposase
MTIGRPTKFTPEVRAKLMVAIRKGAPYSIAANYAGISESLFKEWRAAAKKGENPEFVSFMAELKEAEGETALTWLDKIDNAMNDGNWQAAAWKLERRYFSEFSANPVVREEVKKLIKDVKKLKKHGAHENASQTQEIHTESPK